MCVYTVYTLDVCQTIDVCLYCVYTRCVSTVRCVSMLCVSTVEYTRCVSTVVYIRCVSTLDVVLTSKHHEGWCNFKNSYHWNWNSIDEGPKRDLVGDLTNSVRKAGLHMGLYHSLREWFNPAYIAVRYSTHHTSISL